VNQAALKAFDQRATDCAPESSCNSNVVLPFVQPDNGITAEIVRGTCELRRKRDDAFAGKLFGDPTWDMLLQLYAAHLDSLRMSIGRLTRLCGVPATTVLRRLAMLEDRNLVTRTNDPFDARRVYVALAPAGVEAMESCFIASGRRAAFL